MLRFAALALLALSARAATVSGAAYLRSGSTRKPLAGVRVVARAADGADLLQAVETDALGRYVLDGLSRTRVAVSASKRGYFSRAVASAESNLVLDLAADESLAGADFEVFPGGVITGRITDSLSEPIEGVLVQLWRITHYGGRHRTPGAGSASSDDRGIYRVFGLEPGRYVLLARSTHRLGEQRSSVLYYPGTHDEARAAEIEVPPGGEASGIDLTFASEAVYRIAGNIADVERDRLQHITVQAAAGDPGAAGSLTVSSSVDAEGKFALAGLATGSYVLTAFDRTGRARGDNILARQRVELQANVSNLVLRPGRPGSLSGRVTFSDALPARSRPEQISIRLNERGGYQSASAQARAPEYRFEISNVWPGVYTLTLASPGNAFLKKLAQGGKKLDNSEVLIPDSGSASVELEVAVGVGRVRGIAKAPGGAPLPHARIALAASFGSPVEFRTAQADQRGRWILPDVHPGEYRICAWPAVEVDALYAPETWQRAGAAVKRFAVDPGAEVDLELTAVNPAAVNPVTAARERSAQ